MILHPYTEIPITSFHKVRDNALWLRDFLSKQKQPEIQIEKGSDLELALSISEKFPNWAEEEKDILEELKTPEILSKAIGLSFLASILSEAARHLSFKNALRLLPDLTKSNPIMHEASESTQPRNAVFELEVASIFIASGLATETFNEPDVRVHVTEEVWDIPCKMIYSKEPATLGDRVEEGINQSLKHKGDFGLVVLGISNRIDHENFMPLFDENEDIRGSFRTPEAAYKLLGEKALMPVIDDLFIQASNPDRFLNGRQSSKFRGILVIVHTVCLIGKAPVTLSRTALIGRRDIFRDSSIYGPEEGLCKRFHETALNIFAK